jgi:aminoglycoside phosphotransferase (APT) family kinase protein
MSALGKVGFPVPTMRALCEDDSVAGATFYVMDFLEGRIFRDPQLPDVAPKERAAIYDSMNDVMAKLHKVDFNAIGLGDYGRPGNYFERQIARFITQYRSAQTDQIPEMEQLIDWMPAHIPAEDSVSIAHGDYRLENTMFHATEPRMIAVLDWELVHIGDPAEDLGWLCVNSWRFGETKHTVGGFGSVEQLLEGYRTAGGRNMTAERIKFWEMFGTLKWGIMCMTMYQAFAQGTDRSVERAAIGRRSSETEIDLVNLLYGKG